MGGDGGYGGGMGGGYGGGDGGYGVMGEIAVMEEEGKAEVG